LFKAKDFRDKGTTGIPKTISGMPSIKEKGAIKMTAPKALIYGGAMSDS